MKEVILILGGGIEAVAGIKVAREMGLRIVVMDINPNAPGVAYADDFIHANVYDEIEAEIETLKFTKRSPIHGVVAIAVDAAVTVARLAFALGIPGVSQETAFLATNKLAMKERFKERGVPIPWFSKIDDLEHLEKLVRETSFPLVMKPVDSRGARGVIRLGRSIDLQWAYESALSFSKSRVAMVEEWIEGPQISTEAIVYDDVSVFCATGDRNYSRLDEVFPFVVEDGGGCPSYLSPEMDSEFARVTLAAAKALGLNRGSIKGDLVVGSKGVIIIEVAARLSGGYFCTHTIPLVYGIDLVGAVIEIALGRTPDIEALRSAKVRQYQANRFLFLPAGIVRSVENVEKVRSHSWVKVLEVYVKEGSRVSRVSDHTRRGGTVMTIGETREMAHSRAEQAISDLKIGMADQPTADRLRTLE